MSQHELIKQYIREHGSLLPAKIYGEIYKGEMFGSETSKRCRELRKKGVLRSEGEGKFTRFFFKEMAQIISQKEESIREWMDRKKQEKVDEAKVGALF